MRCSQRALLSRWLRFYARTHPVRPIFLPSLYVSPSLHPAAIAPAAPVAELGFVRRLHPSRVMSAYFPRPFGRRQIVFTLLALLLPICTILIAHDTYIVGGGILILSTIVGTIVFVTSAGRDRCFFTGLFTFLQFGIWFLLAIANLDAGGRLSESDIPLIFSQVFLYFVICPIVFAWAISRITKRETTNA